MNTNHDQFNGSVLLIGGSSGSGKTQIAQDLTRRWSISLLLVDDIRLALQQSTTPTQLPDLHVFLSYRTEHWRFPEAIRDDWIRVGQAMVRPLQAIIAHHIAVPSTGPLIIEGDGILPTLVRPDNFAALKDFSGHQVEQVIRAVFLEEPEEEWLLANLRARGRGFQEWNGETQRAFAHASWLFGQWLSETARACNVPVLRARPYATIIERIRSVLE